jgi:small GTP-binding protein
VERENLKSKICLVGDNAVGKTSLIRRYVLDLFEDRYLTTLGTKVSKKEIEIPFPNENLVAKMDMLIWDIMGQHGFQELLKEAYFYGVRGILAVVDITRRSTLDGLDDWVACVEDVAGPVPMLLAVNKTDLAEKAEFGLPEITERCDALGCSFLWTSAKTGENVEAAFQRLAAIVAERQIWGASR